MNQQKPFRTVLAGFAVILALLPVVAAANSILTEGLNRAGWWRPIQEFIVPWQAGMVAAAISPFGIDSRLTPGSTLSAFYMIKDGGSIPVDLSWSCLGWQGGLLLIVSLFAGLRGAFSTFSRIKCVLFGLFGTLLVNIFRMSLIAIGIYYVNSLAAQIVHDYFAAFLTLIWLIFFWWFSYSYVLEENITH